MERSQIQKQRDYGTKDELVQHLKKTGITVPDDRQLLHTGYYHGYKGYRFFREYDCRLPFSSYEEIYATITFDTQLKSLFYGKVMYLETALKSIAGEIIIQIMDSSDIRTMYDTVVQSYQNANQGASENRREVLQQRKLNLQSVISRAIQKAYQNRDPKIMHFYTSTKYRGIPLWAVIEILTLGDFAYLLSCLDWKTRDRISQEIGLNLRFDAEREMLHQSVQLLRDLRNAIAHNDVIYDTRFHPQNPPRSLRQCIQQEIGLESFSLRPVEDYLIFLCYFLFLLGFPNETLLTFVSDFCKEKQQYQDAVGKKIAAYTVDPNFEGRIQSLKNYLKK